MRFLSFIGLTILLSSCSDFSKGEQLESIAQLNKTVDSIETVLIENKIEDLEEISLDAETVTSRIKENLNSDTLDLKLAKKIDAYMSMYRSIGNYKKIYSKLKLFTKEEKITLNKLQKDIENGDVHRKKYGEYVLFEGKKVKQLTGVLNHYVKGRKKAIDTSLTYHDSLYEFAFELITE